MAVLVTKSFLRFERGRTRFYYYNLDSWTSEGWNWPGIPSFVVLVRQKQGLNGSRLP